MPAHSETRHSPYTPRQIYDLVIDVPRYPEFLPWCRAARMLSREREDTFLAELVISFRHLTERYTSRVYGTCEGREPRISVQLVSGPFEHLRNEWCFVPHPQGGTDIHFLLDFKFKSRLLEMLIGGLFARAAEKMTQAFMTRADALYGTGGTHDRTPPA
jgi:coenzyme Q-binding protein COQ10